MFMIVVNILSVMIIVIFCRLPSILTHWMSQLVSSSQWKLLRWMYIWYCCTWTISIRGCMYIVFKWNREGMSFCLWSLRGDYLIENWLPIRGIIGIQLAEPWGNEGSDEFCGTTKIFWPSSPLLPGNKQSIITSPKVKYFSLSYASLSWMKTWCTEAAKVTAWSDFWALD